MNLPPALAPWAPYLRDFPLDVGAALGDFARRVAVLLGPNGQDFDQPEGEVDGYDGLTRRGLPERMLLSDWLLAQEVPDEWARRAAEGELGYLQLARRAPQKSQVVAALFDAGPDLLGAPRLGQLAALLVLARRARENGAELVWGIAQQPTSQLWRDVSPSGAMALLEARGSAPATMDDLETWREVLGARDELWLIGGPEIAALAVPGESKLLFEDPFEVAPSVGGESNRGLDVAACPDAREVRRARLDLPSDALCTRLLRDPFGAKGDSGNQVRQVKKALAPTSNLVWIGNSGLAARSASGGVAVFRVPSSPRGGVAKPKHYQTQITHFDFIGEHQGAIFGARIERAGVTLFFIGGSKHGIALGYYNGSSAELAASAPELRPLKPLWNLKVGYYEPVLLLPGGELCRLAPVAGSQQDRGGYVESLEYELVAAQGSKMGVVAVSSYQSAARVLRFKPDARIAKGFDVDVEMLQNEVTEAFWEGALQFQEASWRHVAAYREGETWFVHWTEAGQKKRERIEVAPGETVFGVVSWNSKASPALLVRGAGERGLSLRGLGWRQPLTGEAVTSAVVAPETPHLAWLADNELTIYSLFHDAVLARWQWGDE